MDLLYVKATHIVFVVSWFAALFYIVRLLIYTREAQDKTETEKTILTPQLLLMQKRLFNIIGWPAMVLTLITGLSMIYMVPAYLTQPWMWLKLILVVILIFYHLLCARFISEQQKGVFNWSSTKLRMFNEIATILLVGIVFLVVIKSSEGLLWGILGIVALGAVLTLSVMLYKKSRSRSNS
jgi:putative membrane protein